MNSHKGRARGWILGTIFVLLAAAPAFAHKINVFAGMMEGRIEGDVYTASGDMLKDCPVTFLGPDGEKLGETRTNKDGAFQFQPTAKVDHRIVVDTGDGHHAEFTLHADELGDIASVPDKIQTETQPEAQTGGVAVPEDLDERIADAVSKQIFPLRKQIDQYEQRTRFRDVLGGIGYIFGVTGVAFYFMARKQAKK